MTKKARGAVRVTSALFIAGLIGLGALQYQVKTNTKEVDKKVDKDVFVEFKESNEAAHERTESQLDTMHTDIKTLLQK